MAIDQAPPHSGAPAGNGQPPEGEWPGIALTYDLVRPSYELMVRRFEVVENRLRGIVTFTVTVTFGAPVFVRAVRDAMPYDSPLFIAALCVAAVIVVAGMLGTALGMIAVVDPRQLEERALGLPDWQFKRNVIRSAAAAFESNAKKLDRKSRLAGALSVLLIAEVCLFGVWALQPS